MDCPVGIIALSHIQQSRKAGDGAKIHIIETEFAAGKCQDHRIFRRPADKLSVIISSGTRAVTTSADEEEMADISGFYGGDNIIGSIEDGVHAKSGGDLMTAVKAGKILCFAVSAQVPAPFR